MENDTTPHGQITLPGDFFFDEITPYRRADRVFRNAELTVDTTPTPPLGVVANFTGTFSGPGLNLIFRPNSAAPTTTTFPVAVNPPPPAPPSENVLEINLTEDTIAFSKSLGNVPNRGLEAQNDIFLNGVPYVQTVNDVTNPDTGKGDAKGIPIHFEPGLWMHIPATSTTPVIPASVTRMASIPHGTTINAQGLAPATSIPRAPDIPTVDITPFLIGSNPPNLISFASQTVTNNNSPRIPQDLTKFIAAGTITDKILKDPNQVLRDAIQPQKIVKTITLTVSTSPAAPEFGGGTDNIAFLEGDKTIQNPNAHAVQMSATFWIETVEHKITVPRYVMGHPPLRIRAPADNPNLPAPTFLVQPPHDIPEPVTITLTSKQIQYSQVVLLNFAKLTWPHVSVATLVPTDDLFIPASDWPL